MRVTVCPVDCNSQVCNNQFSLEGEDIEVRLPLPGHSCLCNFRGSLESGYNSLNDIIVNEGVVIIQTTLYL